MWICDAWKDYELLDTSDGDKLERWGNYILIRPDPQVIWHTEKKHPLWQKADASYHRSKAGGGAWSENRLPESWTVRYGDLRFRIKPMGFKHTGLFPEQAANWDWFSDLIRRAGRPIKVLNLFAIRAVPPLPRRRRARLSAMSMPRKAWSPPRKRMRCSRVLPTRPIAISWTTAGNSSSGRSAAGTDLTR